MADSIDADTRIALDLALTIRHDGQGGVVDDLAEPGGLTTWVRGHAELLPGADAFIADATALAAVRDLRAAVRALFARAVRPGDPSPADAARLLPVPQAVLCLNTAAALAPTVPVLTWDDGAEPVVRRQAVGAAAPLPALLARAALAFLASPDRSRLHACHAALRALLHQGTPATGVVQTLVREPCACRPPSRTAQEVRAGRGGLTEESGRWSEARAGRGGRAPHEALRAYAEVPGGHGTHPLPAWTAPPWPGGGSWDSALYAAEGHSSNERVNSPLPMRR